MTQSKPKVTIGIESDAFTIECDGRHYYINQEDDPSKELKKLFETLGYEVEVEENY